MGAQHPEEYTVTFLNERTLILQLNNQKWLVSPRPDPQIAP